MTRRIVFLVVLDAPARFALSCALVLVVACSSPQPAFEAAAACIPPADPGSHAAGSLPALVDRADVIALVKVAKAEHIYAGYHDRLGARRLTVSTIELAKGAAPDQFSVTDGPCPLLAASDGETFIALLESTPDGAGFKPVGLPTSVLRASPTRTLTQLMVDIRAVRPMDGAARSLFERYGWTVTAKHDFGEFDLPALSEFDSGARQIQGAMPFMSGPLKTYAALSADVGLDPRPYAAQRVERLSFWLERKPPEYRENAPFGHVLIADRKLIAAWVTSFPEGGPFSVPDRASALSAPVARQTFPPANRFPNGVNVARLYDLASAKAVHYKTGGGANGAITDAARVRAFATALDVLLPTSQAVVDRTTTPAHYYFSFEFEGRVLSVEYDQTTEVLSVPSDGYSVKPGPDFAALVRTIR